MNSENKVRAVIFDWAGTTVDHGCMAPVGVFVEVFRRHGVTVTAAQAREPMGTHKREHIRRMCAMPAVAAAWKAVHGTGPTDADVDALYVEATPLQIEVLPDHAEPIPGTLDAVAKLRAQGIRIGSTTGYNREQLDVLVAAAAKQGFEPEVAVAASEVPEGRPSPYLCWTAAMRLGAWPASACVKVGDTPVDIEAGRNAGFWTIGVARTGNLVGLTLAELRALPFEEQFERSEAAQETLRRAGAHYAVDSIADVPACVRLIEQRLARGERP